MRIFPTQRQAARAGGWVSLAVIAGHTVMVYLAFAKGGIPIDNPFVRWELLNAEFCFALLVVAASILAIRHAGPAHPDGGTSRVASTVLAVLWSADALYAVIAPMPLAADRSWVHVVLPLMLAALAGVCWIAVFAERALEAAAVRRPASARSG